MRATDLARLLAERVDEVVRLLLPNGKREGHEWRVGSLDGEAGKSMGVHMSGNKAGVWSDFSSGEAGDLIGLWMRCKGLDLRETCKEAADYLGIREDRIDPPRRQFSRPTKEGVRALSEEHRRWLTEERKIAPATLAAYKIATRDGAIMFPYLRDGELIGAKYRTLPKQFRQDKDCEPCLFGWQAMAPEARVLMVCEGELDAMSWHTYGVTAVSVPMGGGTGAKQAWVEAEFERLALFDTIFLSMDSDGPGQEAERDLVERLGRDRCRVLRLPFKDANECLMQGVSPGDMLACLRDARSLDPSELRDIGEFEDAIWAEYSRVDSGILLPWKKTQDLVRLRPGETSIWAGVNGHGKSTLVSHAVAGIAAAGHKVCVASMEYRTAMWMMRMNRQLAGRSDPSEEFCRYITRELRGRILAFDVQGAAKARRILEVFRYARRRYGTELFVIDNLTKCGFADDDYSGQKAFVEEISDFARGEQTHVAIVAHMRKSDSEDKPAGKMNVKGSGGITDMADSVFEVWRNKPREKAIKEAQRLAHETRTEFTMPEKYKDSADSLLLVHKQRATGEEPTFLFWFDKDSTQYVGKESYRGRALIERPLTAVSA